MFTPTFRASTRLASTARAFSTTPRAAVARMSIVGRLGVAPEEVTTTANNKTLVRYVVGTSQGRGEDKKTSWFRVASFVDGKAKDYLMSVPKGALLHVDADASMQTYTDNEGNKRTNLSLIARHFEVLSRPKIDEHSEFDEEGLVREPVHV